MTYQIPITDKIRNPSSLMTPFYGVAGKNIQFAAKLFRKDLWELACKVVCQMENKTKS